MNRPWLLPLTPLWRLGVFLKNHAYDRHLTPRSLTRPVISIGSLSAGGAGKTPVVIALAQLLARHNISADVLSRGYGRGSGTIEQVDPHGDPIRFGDEPLEIAQSPIPAILSETHDSLARNSSVPPPSRSDEWETNNHQSATIPVFVGTDRYAAGLVAEATLPGTQLHLLDDGFQHRRLARTLDLVLLTAEDLRDTLLPAGNLREPLSSLRRAHAIILREDEAPTLLPTLARLTPATATWVIQRNLHLLSTDHQHAIAFCGIARPASFFAQLRSAGCSLAGEVAFPDHYRYTSEDISALCKAAARAHATSFITTAKDAVKLTSDLRGRLEAVAPLHVARLQVRFLDEARVLASLRNHT